MERIAGINAMFTVSTRRVIESTVVVCMVVQIKSDATKVYCSVFKQCTTVSIKIAVVYMIHLRFKRLSKFSLHFFLDIADYMIFSTPNHLPLFVGGIVGVGACMITIIGVVVAIFVIR